MLIKAFRLFVSSTFADFTAERDVLQREVFPALDLHCMAKGYQFYPIDLRWGVNEEAQLDQRTTEICLNEVRAAKADYPPPNFLILIGNRYGYVPLPYAIARDEFEAILAWLRRHNKHGAADRLCAVYQRDDNHLVPSGGPDGYVVSAGLTPAFTLRSRIDELPELRPAEAWAARQAELRTALQEAADGLLAVGEITTASYEKYFLSLTDQEIILGLPRYEPVADEGQKPTHAEEPEAVVFIRELRAQADSLAGDMRHYFEKTPRLEELKAGIRRVLPADHIVTAQAEIAENGRLSVAYVADFASQIESRLRKAIDRHIDRVEAMESAPDFALASERAAHRVFGAQKLNVFVGRERELAAIARYLAGPSDLPLVLYGRSGLGKSALTARATALAEGGGKPVIARFIGASAASSNLRALLVSVVEDLAAHGCVAVPDAFEQDANKFNAQIEKLLSSISDPVILFLDALDQLQRPHDLGWLPAKLPKALKLVVSVLDDQAYEADSDFYRDLKNRLAPDAFLEIEPLNLARGREILSALNQESRHRLQHSQLDYILGKFEQAGGSPLYLKTAFEIARSWKSYHMAGTGRFVLAGNTEGVVAQFVAELSSVQHHEPALVNRTLRYLAAASNGLSAKELTEILSHDEVVMRAITSQRHGALTDKLPLSVWVRLNRDLSPFLVEKQIDEQPLLQFFHRQFAQIVREQHYEFAKTESHAALAAYFQSQTTEADGKRSYGRRSLSELPYQLIGAGLADELTEILTDLHFIQARCEGGLLRELQLDYHAAREMVRPAGVSHPSLHSKDDGETRSRSINRDSSAETLAQLRASGRDAVTSARVKPLYAEGQVFPEAVFGIDGGAGLLIAQLKRAPKSAVADDGDSQSDEGNPERLKAFDEFINACSQWLSVFAEQTIPIAYNYSSRGVVSEAASAALGGFRKPWVAIVNRPRQGSGEHPCRLTLRGHREGISQLAFVREGTQVVSWGADWSLRAWDTRTGECKRSMNVLDRYYSHPGAGLGVTANGEIAVVVGSKFHHYPTDALQVVDLRGSEFGRTLKHNSSMSDVALTSDGRLAVASSGSGGLTVWDVATGGIVRKMEERRSCRRLTLTPDGAIAVSWDYRDPLRVWDIESGECVGVLKASEAAGASDAPYGYGDVKSVQVAANGRLVFSACGRVGVQVWDLVTRECIRVLEADLQREGLGSVAITPDGRIAAISMDYGRNLQIWDVASGRRLKTIRAGQWTFSKIALSDDGRLATSGDTDGTVRIWDLTKGNEEDSEESSAAEADKIRCLATSPSGSRVLSGHEGGHIRIWNFGEAKCQQAVEAHAGPVASASIAALQGLTATGGSDKTIRLWNFDDCSASGVIPSHKGPIWDVHLSANGMRLFATDEHHVYIWDVAQKRPHQVWEWCLANAHICLTPDEEGVVLVSHDERENAERLSLWHIASGRRTFSMRQDVRSFCLTPDGKILVWTTSRGGLNAIRLREGNEPRVLLPEGNGDPRRGHVGSIRALAPCADGRFLLSIGSDATLRVWDLVEERPIAFAHTGEPFERISRVTASGRVACGGSAVVPSFLILKNIPSGVPIATIAEVRPLETDHHNIEHLVSCSWCEAVFVPPATVLDEIWNPARETNADGKVGSRKQALSSRCPHCSGQLRFNPFVARQGLPPAPLQRDFGERWFIVTNTGTETGVKCRRCGENGGYSPQIGEKIPDNCPRCGL